jgi:hypothetical protein
LRARHVLRGGAMSNLSSSSPQCGTAWLLALGERLRVEYDRMAEPLPPRLIALLEQLGTSPQERVQRQGSPTLSRYQPRYQPRYRGGGDVVAPDQLQST